MCFRPFPETRQRGRNPYQHLFDYLDNRSNLAPQERTQLDLTELTAQIQKHPDRPQDLYRGRIDVADFRAAVGLSRDRGGGLRYAPRKSRDSRRRLFLARPNTPRGLQGAPMHGFAITPDGKLLLATSKVYSRCTRIRCRTSNRVGHVHVGGPSGMDHPVAGRQARLCGGGR